MGVLLLIEKYSTINLVFGACKRLWVQLIDSILLSKTGIYISRIIAR